MRREKEAHGTMSIGYALPPSNRNGAARSSSNGATLNGVTWLAWDTAFTSTRALPSLAALALLASACVSETEGASSSDGVAGASMDADETDGPMDEPPDAGAGDAAGIIPSGVRPGASSRGTADDAQVPEGKAPAGEGAAGAGSEDATTGDPGSVENGQADADGSGDPGSDTAAAIDDARCDIGRADDVTGNFFVPFAEGDRIPLIGVGQHELLAEVAILVYMPGDATWDAVLTVDDSGLTAPGYALEGEGTFSCGDDGWCELLPVYFETWNLVTDPSELRDLPVTVELTVSDAEGPFCQTRLGAPMRRPE